VPHSRSPAKTATSGTWSRRSHIRNTSSTSAASTSSGMSANPIPASRSTACTHTSRQRIQGTSLAGTMRPCAVRTCAVQASSGSSRIAVASRPVAARTSPRRCAGGSAAASVMPASRASGEAYIGVSTPVRAQVSRLTRASALRATCASSRCRDQPGSSDGVSNSSSVSRPRAVPRCCSPSAHQPSTSVGAWVAALMIAPRSVASGVHSVDARPNRSDSCRRGTTAPLCGPVDRDADVPGPSAGVPLPRGPGLDEDSHRRPRPPGGPPRQHRPEVPCPHAPSCSPWTTTPR
jgi:hypothetical protein